MLNLERETSNKIESVTSQNNVDLLKIILDRRRTTKRNESDPDSKVFQVNFWFNLLRSLGQVLALTQLFSVCFFLQKIYDLPAGQINYPCIDECSLLFLPATPSSLSGTLGGLF